MPSARLCFAAVVVAASLAACGSSSTPTTTSATTTPSSSTSSSASGPATVKVINVSGYGNALGSASGKPLYMLSTDKTNSSSCSGSCTSTWPPLTVSGKPVAGSGVTASMLGEFKRSGGGEQVSYNGHALYTFTGATAEDGIAEDGGIWYLMGTNGEPIKHSKSGSY